MVREKSIARDIWQEAGKQGLFGFGIPEEYGGAGSDDYRFNAVAAEEVAAFSAAVSSCFGIHSDVNPPYIVDLGTDEQKQRWLPGMASGELISAIAMTEPSGGSDLAALKTTAVRPGDDSGDWFVIEDGTPGFSRGRKLDKVGQDESDTAELFFENVRVSDANRLGDEGMGFIAMMQRLPQERIGGAVSNTANAAQILQETIEYAKERKAFGQPIGTFQHNKFKLAELVTKVEVTQAYVDDCVIAHTKGELTAVDAAKAEWWSAQVQNDVLDECVQLYGGYGYMNEYRVARAWRDARVTKIWAGSNEIMKELIGRDLGL